MNVLKAESTRIKSEIYSEWHIPGHEKITCLCLYVYVYIYIKVYLETCLS